MKRKEKKEKRKDLKKKKEEKKKRENLFLPEGETYQTGRETRFGSFSDFLSVFQEKKERDLRKKERKEKRKRENKREKEERKLGVRSINEYWSFLCVK